MNYSNILFFPFLLFSCFIFPQTTGNRAVDVTLPVLALLDIEPAGNITMSFTAPADAGRPIIVPTPNTTKWINYTSAITSGGVSRRITASVNQVIPGITIRIQAAASSGTGGGILGTPTAAVTLSATAQTVISGIGGAFTGNGANNGHRLTISLSANTYANLSARTNTPIVITYTITE
nr:hypothetical protein [uncultured Chryseobacterium sp.]